MHLFVNILLLLLMVSDGFCSPPGSQLPSSSYKPVRLPEHNSKELKKQQKMDNKPCASSSMRKSSGAIAKAALNDHYKNNNYKVENIKVDNKVQRRMKTNYDMTLSVKDDKYIQGREMHVVGEKNKVTGKVEKVNWGWLN